MGGPRTEEPGLGAVPIPRLDGGESAVERWLVQRLRWEAYLRRVGEPAEDGQAGAAAA